MQLHIREVTEENWRAVVVLTVSQDQEAFIEDNAYSVAQSRFEPEWQSVGLYDESMLIGYAMYGIDHETGDVWLDRFMIDHNFQGKGYGRAIMPHLIERIKRIYQCNTIRLSLHYDNIPAQRLYESFGFRLNGEIDSGEAVMILDGV